MRGDAACARHKEPCSEPHYKCHQEQARVPAHSRLPVPHLASGFYDELVQSAALLAQTNHTCKISAERKRLHGHVNHKHCGDQAVGAGVQSVSPRRLLSCLSCDARHDAWRVSALTAVRCILEITRAARQADESSCIRGQGQDTLSRDASVPATAGVLFTTLSMMQHLYSILQTAY
jgi:hypothetical protein